MEDMEEGERHPLLDNREVALRRAQKSAYIWFAASIILSTGLQFCDHWALPGVKNKWVMHISAAVLYYLNGQFTSAALEESSLAGEVNTEDPQAAAQEQLRSVGTLQWLLQPLAIFGYELHSAWLDLFGRTNIVGGGQQADHLRWASFRFNATACLRDAIVIVLSVLSYFTSNDARPESGLKEAAYTLATVNNGVIAPLALLFAKQETELVRRHTTTRGVQAWLRERVLAWL